MTGPRNVAAVASIFLLCAAIGCTNLYEIPIETPIQPKMDVTPFTRVLVAGFISGGTDDVDGNLETVRLLRSQLRSKSNLRVIEAEVLPLAEIARDQVKAAPASPASASTDQGRTATPAAGETANHNGSSHPVTESGGQAPAATQTPQSGEGSPQQVQPVPALPGGPDATDGKIRNEKDLERYQAIFENTEFWKKLGQEHQNPSIVTG